MASPALRENILTPANIVTLVRIVLIPLFVAVLVSPWPALTENLPLWGSLQPWIAAAVFVFISATDAVDGYLARSRNEVTDFGKFLDPLADKILVCAALLGLVNQVTADKIAEIKAQKTADAMAQVLEHYYRVLGW